MIESIDGDRKAFRGKEAMRFVWVIILFGSQLLSAASLAVITANNASFPTACAAGTIDLSPCPPGGISGGFYQVTAEAGPISESMSPAFLGATTISINADAGVQYLCPVSGPCPPLIPLSATAEASETISGYTGGPSRLGSVQVSVSAGVDHGFLPYFSVTDGTNVYGDIFENGWGCCGGTYSNTLPFQLGGPFSVSATTPTVGGVCDGSNAQCADGAGAFADISFVFLEPDGSTIPFETRITPEPCSWALCALGLVFATPRFRRLK